MTRIQVVSRSKSTVYLLRASELSAQMDRAAAERAWNAVGILGVHAVISACDALTIGVAGQRWAGPDHQGVRGLIESLGLRDVAQPMRQVREVLEQKSKVEYLDREFKAGEAETVRTRTLRILTWVESQLSG